MIDLDELERLEKAATPGPWEHGGSYVDNEGRLTQAEWVWEGTSHAFGDPDAPDTRILQTGPNDAAFIAAARNAMPAIIRELRAARACIEEIRRISGPTRTILAGVLDAYDAATKGES